MAKHQPLTSYTCCLCPAKCTEHPDRPRALLRLCEPCFDKRFAAGTAARLKAEKAEAAHG